MREGEKEGKKRAGEKRGKEGEHGERMTVTRQTELLQSSRVLGFSVAHTPHQLIPLLYLFSLWFGDLT